MATKINLVPVDNTIKVTILFKGNTVEATLTTADRKDITTIFDLISIYRGIVTDAKTVSQKYIELNPDKSKVKFTPYIKAIKIDILAKIYELEYTITGEETIVVKRGFTSGRAEVRVEDSKK